MHNLKKSLFAFLIVFIGFLSISPAHAVQVGKLRFGAHGTYVRLVLELTEEADFRADLADTPPRLRLTLPSVTQAPQIDAKTLPEIIKDIRLKPLSGGQSEISFILKNKATIRSAFLIPATQNKPTRLVVDLKPANNTVFSKSLTRTFGTLPPPLPKKQLPFATAEGTNLNPIKSSTIPTPALPKVATPQNPEDLPLIMIDPGHGGFDSGAVRKNIREKDITLAVARNLRSALLATGKFKVKLTRDKDVFIRLGERVAMARRAGAALFISLHADAMPSQYSSAHGASFYTLSEKATDQQAAHLAKNENAADLLGNTEAPTKDKDLTAILVDLTLKETTNLSERFATDLTHIFAKANIPTLSPAHKNAGFMVLKAPDIPSVLIEMGFLSNPAEIKKLKDPTYRKTLADKIALSIERWFTAKNAK